MDYVALAAELTAGHPDTGPYDADDGIAAEQLNTLNRTRNRGTMSATEVLNAADAAELSALSDTALQIFMGLLGMGSLDPFGREAIIVSRLFGSGSVTVSTLATARVEEVSRAEELGLGVMKAGYVQQARGV